MDPNGTGKPQVTPHEPEHVGSRRDPEERPADQQDAAREKTLDKTLADSFPTSDPPSTIPDPVAAEAPNATNNNSVDSEVIAALPPGSWAAISDQERRVVGTGATREAAVQSATGYQESQLRVVRVPQDPEAPEQAA